MEESNEMIKEEKCMCDMCKIMVEESNELIKAEKCMCDMYKIMVEAELSESMSVQLLFGMYIGTSICIYGDKYLECLEKLSKIAKQWEYSTHESK